MSPKELRKVVAENIRVAVKQRGWTLVQLADFATVGKSQVYDVTSEGRAPTTDWLAKVADALGVEPAALLVPPRPRGARRKRP